MDYKKKLLEQGVMVRGRFQLLFACWGDSVSTRTHSSKLDGDQTTWCVVEAHK